MTNTFSPNGFMPVKRIDGAAWTVAPFQRLIAKANTHQFFRGDPVIGLASGYIDGGAGITVGALPTQGIVGIFWGCELQPLASGSPWNQGYVVGAAQAADTPAMLIIDPMTIFEAWVGTGASGTPGGPVTIADIGKSINFQLGIGNLQTQQSGAYLDYATASTATAALPFVIVDFPKDPPGVNGNDSTSVGNKAYVAFNQNWLKAAVTPV